MDAPARTRLTRARVLTAAVALADREGPEALTVRRLAEDLDVHPTSLYNHVASKAAILDGVVEQLLSEVAAPEDGGTWQDWVRALATGFRDLARAHPGAFLVLARRPADTDAAHDITERGLAAFRAGGFAAATAVQAVRAVSLAVLGLAVNECAPLGTVDLAAGGWSRRPALREAEAALRPGDEHGHWDLLVDALLAGLHP